MNDALDRLYNLLPDVYRDRDERQGFPLRALLRAIGEQVDVVDRDITRLYENWFIETCDDWVVPYLGDLIGYSPLYAAGDPGAAAAVAKILVPRREVANTLRFRRRKGTLAVLEELARAVTGWPALAVEFYKVLGITPSLTLPRPKQGRLVDVRDGAALSHLGTPFDDSARRPDVRGIASHRTTGRPNIPDVGVFVWRLKTYRVSKTPARSLTGDGHPHHYTFSALGNRTPLYTDPTATPPSPDRRRELTLPVPISRRAFEDRPAGAHEPGPASTDYYGIKKSLAIWTDFLQPHRQGSLQLLEASQIIPADLGGWHYLPPPGKVAVDPVLGLIAFPEHQAPNDVFVQYHHAFPTDLGGGEYERLLTPRPTTYAVSDQDTLESALARWREKKPDDAVIEFTANEEYKFPKDMELQNQRLEIRAANGKRPIIRYSERRPNALMVIGQKGEEDEPVTSRLVLDGLLITGRPVSVVGDFAEVVLRHCTLVPGWELDFEGRPRRPEQPSLILQTPGAHVTIERCILGGIVIDHDEVPREPCTLVLRDSIVDSAGGCPALHAPDCVPANARLTVCRCTVRGAMYVHAIDLAENSIFDGRMVAARQQQGCVRFCYVPRTSRTPRRYECQPDQAVRAAADQAQARGEPPPDPAVEELRVEPQFEGLHYGSPTYLRLAASCADEIRSGADDESEMGVYHDLLEPQKLANLATRLDEFTPAALQVGAILAS